MHPINTAPLETFILVWCPSGYTTTPWRCHVARKSMTYKPGRWLDHAGDNVTDYGPEPWFWQPLPSFSE